MRRFGCVLISIIVAASFRLAAQITIPSGSVNINSDSIREAFDKRPYFGLYKDNYFIFGGPIGMKPTVKNTNIKFQISFSQRITNSVLPWNTYLYIFYSQKCFWNVLENSLPMTDLNFNPGIGLAKPFFVHGRYIGKAMLMLEHESNGKDGDASRSWNKVSLGANIMIDPNFMVHGKFWIPIVDGQNNRDILRYSGIYQIGMQMMTNNRKYNGAVTLVKRQGMNLNYNTILEFGIRLFKDSNQYLFFQYYNGYGEGMLEYNKFHSQLRVGLQIKPSLFSDF